MGTVKVLAVGRLLLPRTYLPATTALGTLYHRGRERALSCGANVVMPDLTPPPYRHYYEIYPGRARPWDQRSTAVSTWRETLAGLGRKVDEGYGHGFRGALREKAP